MQEELLHFVWKYRKLLSRPLYTTADQPVKILDPGKHNHFSGPDFFHAALEIGDQVWVGNVEVHLKSSDWYAHHHESNPGYDNVILHVVWLDDMPVFRKDGSAIPALELSGYIPLSLLGNYRDLLLGKSAEFINCERSIRTIREANGLPFTAWIERLYFERLEQKTEVVRSLLKESMNDWEKVMFVLLLRNFGLKVNGEAFFSLGKALEFSTVRKLCGDILKLEAVLFGMSGLLREEGIFDTYYLSLRREYSYLKHKLKLKESSVCRPEFGKLRPSNFPTVRLSQLANLYANAQNIFRLAMEATSLKALYDIFGTAASIYWDTHYTFGKPAGNRVKKLSRNFIDLLVINTVLPVKYSYACHKGLSADEEILAILSEIGPERNSLVRNFGARGIHADDAIFSQALLQLYQRYCSKNKCLRCTVGTLLLNGKS